MLLLLITFVISGILMMALAIPLINDKVKPNGWYGFRTPKTLKHEDLWYEVNAHTGRLLLWSGIATTVSSVILYPFDLGEDVYVSLVTLVMFIGIFYALFKGIQIIRAYDPN